MPLLNSLVPVSKGLSLYSVVDQGPESVNVAGLVLVIADLDLVHDPSPGTALVPVLAQRTDLHLEKGQRRGRVHVPGMPPRSVQLIGRMEIAEVEVDPGLRIEMIAAALAAATETDHDLLPLPRMPALLVRKRYRNAVPPLPLLSMMSSWY